MLSPGWSTYEWRLRYRTYDVTALVGAGHVLGIALGNGWYRGRLGWHGNRPSTATGSAVIAQLEMTFADGHVQVVGTDESWRAGPSATLPTTSTTGRPSTPGGPTPGCTPDGADRLGRRHAVDVRHPPAGALDRAARCVRHESRRAGADLDLAAGRDAGRLRPEPRRLAAVHRAGRGRHRDPVRHAEVLEDGELGIRPLRAAQATDRFILVRRRRTLRADLDLPRLPLRRGHRLARRASTADVLEAVVVHSELRRTGNFECSDPLLNQLHRNVVWGLRGNFLDVPTDCPQRDERLGWTGDIAVFAPTAAYLFDVAGFLRDWLRRPRPSSSGTPTAWCRSSSPTC